jgi:hypothetical protein
MCYFPSFIHNPVSFKSAFSNVNDFIYFSEYKNVKNYVKRFSDLVQNA